MTADVSKKGNQAPQNRVTQINYSSIKSRQGPILTPLAYFPIQKFLQDDERLMPAPKSCQDIGISAHYQQASHDNVVGECASVEGKQKIMAIPLISRAA